MIGLTLLLIKLAICVPLAIMGLFAVLFVVGVAVRAPIEIIKAGVK